MAKAQAFVIPADVVFQIQDGGVIIENRGDIELHTTFGKTLVRVISGEGSITIHGDVQAGTLQAAGSVNVAGGLTAQNVQAGAAVSLGSASKVDKLHAGSTLNVGGGLTGSSVQAGGAVNLRGVSRIDHMHAGGGIDVAGGLTSSDVQAGGNVNLAGASKVDQMQASGSVDVGGPATFDNVSSSGLTINGALTAGKISSSGGVKVGGGVNAQELRAGGDVSITGETVVKVVSGSGAVKLGGTVESDTIDGGGAVDIAGDVKAGTIRGGSVSFKGTSVTVKGVQGQTSVSIGDAKVAVDAIVAPEIKVAPKTAGRIMVVESQNELGPNAIKGGFRLTDYAEMFGDAQKFLADRGLSAPGEAFAAPVAPEAPSAGAPVAPAAPVIEAVPMVESIAPVVAIESVSVEIEADADSVGPLPTPIVIDKPTTPAVMELEDAGHDEPSVNGVAEHPMHKQLAETVQKIVDSYAQNELPPAVDRLRGLVEAHQYDLIRTEITNIWSELLKFHQKKGLRIQHQVTTTFNSVNSLVKKM